MVMVASIRCLSFAGSGFVLGSLRGNNGARIVVFGCTEIGLDYVLPQPDIAH
jgi:hypothetical protein